MSKFKDMKKLRILSNDSGITLISWLFVLAMIAVLLTMVLSMAYFSSKSNVGDQAVATRDIMINNALKVGFTPQALNISMNQTGNATFQSCVNGAAGCVNGAATEFNLYDTSGTKVAGTSASPAYYGIDGRTPCTSNPAPPSVICPIQAVSTFTATCNPVDCLTRSGVSVTVTVTVSYPLPASVQPLAFGRLKTTSITSNPVQAISILPPTSNTWLPLPTTDAPTARYNHTAVWADTKMIIWGGTGSTGIVNTGAVYQNNTWSPMNTVGAPSARQLASGVWTGSKVLIWGGYDGNASGGFYNDGGIYDPATNTWSPITTSGAPTARYGHSAVWTGARMLIWGGFDGTNSLSDGSSYDPYSNTWSAISSSNAPTARFAHSTVWTSLQLIVWGGFSNGVSLDTGGIYSVGSDSWSAVSTTDAPTARLGHTAVWTGTKMIVWGGYNGSGTYYNDGGVYDPTANTWTAVSTTSAPSSRNDQIAIWANRMIVLGGNNSTPLNSGGAYDPVADAWSAVSTTGAPSARFGHSAVWTGTQMIVFGGTSGSSGIFSDGGIYTP